MAFTAGSVELARAQKLGSILSGLAAVYGITAMSGSTGAQIIEQRARRLGFGVTGLTNGAGFPPFGSSGHTANRVSTHGALEGALQNPAGLTTPNGLTVSALVAGQTVGLYMPEFIRDGSDVTVTNSAGVAGNTFAFRTGTAVNGGFTAALYFAAASGATGTWVLS